jgi:hypothetical protein
LQVKDGVESGRESIYHSSRLDVSSLAILFLISTSPQSGAATTDTSVQNYISVAIRLMEQVVNIDVRTFSVVLLAVTFLFVTSAITGLFINILSSGRNRRERAERKEQFDRLQEMTRKAILSTSPNETDRLQAEGFQFFDVHEHYKITFIDALNGFKEYADLKGYNVTVVINSEVPGKVGLKITVNDAQTTVSTNQVRRDVNEYIQKLNSGDDLSDMPMIQDPVEHK